MLLGYHRNDFKQYGGLKVPLSITLSKKTSSVLIAGKSGSGKSTAGLWYSWQMLSSNESRVYLADYKGGFEYEAFEGLPSYASGDDAIKIIRDFYDFFTAVRDNRYRLKHHHTLFIEEYFGLLSYAEARDKKLKNELMSKVGEMLAVSRGLDIGIFLCVQRADSSNFSAGAREQFQCVLSFGRCSAEQFRMLGFSSELEENPTGSYKAGGALALIDGQEGVQEILVPRIKNVDDMYRGIRYYLDRQPDIPSLTRAVAGGGRTGQ